MGIETGTVMLSIIGPEVVLVLAALGIMMTDLFVKSDAEQPFLMWIGFVGMLGALAVSASFWGKEAAYGFYGMVVADNFSDVFYHPVFNCRRTDASYEQRLCARSGDRRR